MVPVHPSWNTPSLAALCPDKPLTGYELDSDPFGASGEVDKPSSLNISSRKLPACGSCMMSGGGDACNGHTAVVVHAPSSRQASVKSSKLGLVIMTDLPCGFLGLVTLCSHGGFNGGDFRDLPCLNSVNVERVQHPAQRQRSGNGDEDFPVC